MNDRESQLIHSFLRSPSEKVQMSVQKYNGRFYVDLRVWFQTKEDPTFRPTRKGFNFHLDYLPELRQGIERLSRIQNQYREEPTGARH